MSDAAAKAKEQEPIQQITFAELAAAAQRVANAGNAIEATNNAPRFPTKNEDALFDEWHDAMEAFVPLALRHGRDHQTLISLALDEIAIAVRDLH